MRRILLVAAVLGLIAATLLSCGQPFAGLLTPTPEASGTCINIVFQNYVEQANLGMRLVNLGYSEAAIRTYEYQYTFVIEGITINKQQQNQLANDLQKRFNTTVTIPDLTSKENPTSAAFAVIFGNAVAPNDLQGELQILGYSGATINQITLRTYLVRTRTISAEQKEQMKQGLEQEFGPLIFLDSCGLGAEPTTTPTPNSADVEWLAKVIASEAGSVWDSNHWVACTEAERAAVGWTLINRLNAGTYGGSIKEIASAPGQYARNQSPTVEISALAERLLEGQIPDPTEGATHFFSPISMPKEGESTTGFDVGGGLHQVPGITEIVYFPSWTEQLTWVGELVNVRTAYFMFYRSTIAIISPSPTPATVTPTVNCQAIGEQEVVEIDETVLYMPYFVKILRFYSLSSTGNTGSTTFPYQVLQQIENNELMMQAAPKLGIQVSRDEVTEKINNDLISSAGGGENPTGNITLPQTNLGKMYQQWLDYVRLSDSEYRHLVEASLLTQKLKEQLKEKNVPTEAKQVHVYAIQVDTEAKATEVENRLQNGEDFSSLAAQYSIDETTKPYGGDLGWVPHGILLPEVDQVAFNLPPGSVSQPILSTNGYYYLIKVAEIESNRVIDDQYREILASNEFTKWFKEQRNKVEIREYLDQEKITCALLWLSSSSP